MQVRVHGSSFIFYYRIGPVLSVEYILTHFILTKQLLSIYDYYHAHISDEETEARSHT